MLKRMAFAAFAAISMSALAQDTTTTTTTTKTTDNQGTTVQQTTTTYTQDNDWSSENKDWRLKYDTYKIGMVDVNSIPIEDQRRIVRHELHQIPAVQSYILTNFIQNAPSDQADALVKALVVNFKQASMARDEVAMAMFGTSDNFVWLSYPPLTWSTTPGQNSWSAITTIGNDGSTVVQTTTVAPDVEIAMTQDGSRPMRMVMAHRGYREITDEKGLDILCAGLSDNQDTILRGTFQYNDRTGLYSSEDVLDAAICVINYNASLADHLDRYAWYTHFDDSYFGSSHWAW